MLFWTKWTLIVFLVFSQTFLWVLNEDEDFDRAFNKLGVSAVMTDYPTVLRKYLDEKDKAAERTGGGVSEQSCPLLSNGN